ncbi:MAG: alpha-amylase family glycosyl hydrolase, partial [Propionibacterium sp.]|nr:alpha-amylase family glycosyl hydrolase [Propionibacterium sp.]
MSTPTASRASQIGTTPGSGGRPGLTGTDAEPWWRSAVVYQIYPRSFFDADGDGTGDLRGITSHLDHVVSLGADAIWISPWYPSPMVDGGYDVADYCDIHPDLGTLDDAETLIDTAHAKGLRVLIDLVPNHCSAQHPWFREALSGGPGHPMRDRFVFRDGTGAHGELPPNNWPSVFGGAAWQRVVEPDGKPGQWYLHFFDPGQPDWNWDNEEVRTEFDRILRFWFDRGVDGFRVDVADALVKDMSLPDVPIDPRTGRGTLDKSIDNPMWDQPGLAEIQRRWRAIAAEYADTPGGERVFVAEAYLPHDRLVQFLTPDRFQMSFDFEFLQSAWDADSLRWVIDGCLAAHARTGSSNDEQAAGLGSMDDVARPRGGDHVDASTATWVIGNHDVIRPATRY